MIVIRFSAGDIWMTGDEPRYAGEGLGLATAGTLTPSDATWRAFLRASGLRESTYAGARLAAASAPSLAPAAIFGPALRWGGLQAARWFAFAFALAGLAALAVALRRGLGDGPATFPSTVASLTIAALSFPLVVYAWLIYPEVLIFCATSLALVALSGRRPLFALAPAALLPFLHIRTLPLSLAFAAIAVLQARRAGVQPRLPIAVGAYVLALAAFVFLQQSVFGSIAGPAFATHGLQPALLLQRAALQLFDVRHGLLIYAPIFTLAFAGLIAGSLQKRRSARIALALLGAYALTFAWSDAGESYSARFWTGAVPFLAVGLAEWFDAVPPRMLVAALPLALIGAANLVAFTYNQSWFVENRTHALSYEWLGTQLHLPLRLPPPVEGATAAANAAPLAGWLAATLSVITLLTLPAFSRASRQVPD